MRDPKRIDELLTKLGEAWRKCPDQRLGQFLSNFFGMCQQDVWQTEDDEWMVGLQAFIDGEDPQKVMDAYFEQKYADTETDTTIPPKVIFLDIDGVLNEDSTPTRTKNNCIFVDEDKVLRLKKIVDTTQAKIVLSSTWRYDRNDSRYNGDFLELQEVLAAHGLEFYSFTPVDAIGMRRGMEIRSWLVTHSEVKRFVILDDELFDYEERGLLDHLVKTDFSVGGLTEGHALQAIAMLMEDT